MRKPFAHDRLGSPSTLPTLAAERSGGHNWLIAGGLFAALLGLVLLGAWLHLGDGELQVQRALDERAVWLGGYIDGRAHERQALNARLDERVADAYQIGIAEGRRQACPVAPMRWVRP